MDLTTMDAAALQSAEEALLAEFEALKAEG